MKTLFLLDTYSYQFNKRERWLYFILLSFFFSLYMPGITWVYNVLMYVIFVYSFFYNSLAEKWLLIKHRADIILIIIFFLLNCVSALISNNLKVGISFVGLRISLLVLPVAIGSIYIRKDLKDRLIFAFAVATSFAAFGCLLWSISQFLKSGDTSLIYNDNLSAIINLQSIYFAMFINMALFSLFYLAIIKSKLLPVKILVPLSLFLLIIQFLLASRIAIILLFFIIIVLAFYYIIQQKKLVTGLSILSFLLIGSFLLIRVFPQTINRFRELEYTKYDFKNTAKDSHFTRPLTADQWNGANTRMAVWNCAWVVIKNNIFFGTQIGDKKEALKQQYIAKDFKEGFNKNTHNNYLDVWMSLGLIGLILFLSGFFIIPLYQSFIVKDWYGLLLVIAFIVSLTTETYMDRTMGNTMLAFFLSFIAGYKKPQDFNENFGKF